MSNNAVSVIFGGIGYQKPIDITVRGISNIESVEIIPIIGINNSRYNIKNVDFISNTDSNCTYEFVEDIETILKGGIIVNYALITKDGVYEKYDENESEKYVKDKQGNVKLFHKVIFEVKDDENDRYEKDEQGRIIIYYKHIKSGKFEPAQDIIESDDYESVNGETVSYVKVIKDFEYEEYNETHKHNYEITEENTSVGHIIITKLSLDGEPTIYYRKIKYIEKENGSCETIDGVVIKYAYNTKRRVYETYKNYNEVNYRKGDDKKVIIYYKEIKSFEEFTTGVNFVEDQWVLERDDNNQLIKYAIYSGGGTASPKYEVYDPDKKDKYITIKGERVGIPFKMRLTYKNEDNVMEVKSVYINILIPYKAIGSRLKLPVYYRPFYFNSVLLLTPQSLTPNYDYNIRDLYEKVQIEDEKIAKENCYGRLFYSIANGCTIREDLGDSNIYALNDVTLSIINGGKAQNMVINKPFRCFSEMNGSTKGQSQRVVDTEKIDREMMYGITEPFCRKEVNNNETKEIVERTAYATLSIVRNGDGSESLSNKTYIYSGIDKNVFTTGSQTRTEIWDHLFTVDNKLFETITFKMERKCTHYYGSDWLSHYKHTLKFYQKVENEWKEIANYSFNRRKKGRGNYKAYTKIEKGEYGYVLSPLSKSEVENYKGDKIVWRMEFTFKSPSTGKNNVDIYGEYIKREEVKYRIKREGYPCVIKGDNEAAYKITHFNLKGNESSFVVNDDIKYIYCDVTTNEDGDITSNSVFSNGDIISIYEEETGGNAITIDSSKWLDVSFSVTEGHPEDDDDADTIFVGFNDIKFYDDILWSTETETFYDEQGNKTDTKDYTGIHTKGYSTSNIRYFALGEFNQDKGIQDSGSSGNHCGRELSRFLESLYGIGVKKSVKYLRYNGVNINDYIYIKSDKKDEPYTQYAGWKGMHTFFGKNSNGTEVWLSGNSTTNNWACIEVTDILTDLRKNPYQVKTLDSIKCWYKRPYIIGVCDNYTFLDSDAYDVEKNEVYSTIKPHTSRFAIIRLYKIEEPK